MCFFSMLAMSLVRVMAMSTITMIFAVTTERKAHQKEKEDRNKDSCVEAWIFHGVESLIMQRKSERLSGHKSMKGRFLACA